MIECNVCGCLNDSSNAICEECGSDLSEIKPWNFLHNPLLAPKHLKVSKLYVHHFLMEQKSY